MTSPKRLAALGGGGVATYIEDVFSTYLYTGNGSTQTITNDIDLSGKGGLVWLKGRSGATDHALYDTARGATFDLASNLGTAQTTQSTGLTAFNSNGFSLGALAKLNTNAATYTSWTFRKQAKFFDVVTYTGTGANRTISHNLGSTPGCIIVRRTNATGNWAVYHRGMTSAGYYMYLNEPTVQATSSTIWNSTAPTSTEFSVGTNANANGSGDTYVAYLFAHDAGGFGATGTDNVVTCGSYTGNGSATGPTITLNYEPQWILVKRATGGTGGNWNIIDNMRGFDVGANDATLYPNTTDVESITTLVTPTATGFGIATTNAMFNANGSTYIYIAIRRGPMKTPTSGTSVYEGTAYTGDATTQRQIGSTVLMDMLLLSCRSADSQGWTTYAHYVFDRLRSNKWALATTSTSVESGDWTTYIEFDKNIGWDTSSTTVDQTYLNKTGSTFVSNVFKRAPGFFDIVCYSGTGSNRTVTHNLGVAPELMIVKRRETTANAWAVYANNDNTDYLLLNTNAATVDDNTYWNDTSPTASVFSVGTNNSVNASGGTYVAYLFASLAGVSKVGSYTGNGTTTGDSQNIDCGFAAGARFVLIKRINGGSYDWWIFDTARGIVSGNDAGLRLNTTSAELSADIINPYSPDLPCIGGKGHQWFECPHYR